MAVTNRQIKFATIATTGGSGDHTLVASANNALGESCRIKVCDYVVVVDCDQKLMFSDGGSASPLTGQMSLVANGGISSPKGCPNLGPLFQTSVSTALVMTLYTTGGSAGGHLSYYLEP